jgi:SAM-dependent methyltransferase
MPDIRALLDLIKIPPSPSYNLCEGRLKRLMEGLGSRARILDLGSSGKRLGEGVVSLDISHRKGVSVVADAHRLPFLHGSLDLIVCRALLEHVERPGVVIDEMYNCCKKGGRVYVEVPFLQGYHESPSDYWRFTIHGLAEAFRPFEKLETGVCCGPASALAMFLAMLPNALFDSPLLRKLGLFFFGWATFWLKYLDVFLVRAEGTHFLASAFYFLGKKP